MDLDFTVNIIEPHEENVAVLGTLVSEQTADTTTTIYIAGVDGEVLK